MKIAVMAAGGVGGYFGARLAQAGHEVAFLARGPHLAALRSRGLRVASALGDVTLPRLRVTGDPAEIGPVEVVLFAVKLWDTAASAAACKPLMDQNTMVVSVQNGVNSGPLLGDQLGAGQVAIGSAFVASVIAEPGVIQHTGSLAKLAFGALDGSPSPRLEAFAEACRESGFEADIPEDILNLVWQKFIVLVAMSGVTSVVRQSIGRILENPELRAQLSGAMAETAAVGRARGVDLAADAAARQLAFTEGLPYEMTSSMQHDLAGGRRLEVAWLAGEVARLGRAHGYPDANQ